MIKNKNTIAIALFLGLALLWSACKKDEPEDCSPGCTHDTSFENELDWCYFQEGSWWIYQEETTLEKDCVYVWDAEMSTDPEFFEFWAYTTAGEFDLHYYFFEDQEGNSNVSDCRVRRFRRGKINPPFFVGSGYFANFPVIEGDHSWDGSNFLNSEVTTLEIDSNYILNSMDLGISARFSVGHAASEEWDSTLFVISKNIGLVQKILPELNETWALIDYHIIQ